MSYFSFVLETPEKIWYSLTGDMHMYHAFAWCSISNATNCSLSQKWFASEATVCVIATTRDSDIPYSDIQYGINKATVPLWKKIAHYFIMIVIFGLSNIIDLFFTTVFCGPLSLRKYRVCRILGYALTLIGLVALVFWQYTDITQIFVKIYAL